MFLELLSALLCMSDGSSSQKKNTNQKKDRFIWDEACDNCGDYYEDCECLDCDDEECEENW